MSAEVIPEKIVDGLHDVDVATDLFAEAIFLKKTRFVLKGFRNPQLTDKQRQNEKRRF